MKFNRRMVVLTTLLVLLPMAAGVYFWNALPDPMATHFGFDGTPDRYDSRAFTVFGMPAILALIHLAGISAARLDKRNRERNEGLTGLMLWIVPIISLFACGLIFRSNLVGIKDMTTIGMASCGVMFTVLGNLMPKIRQNHVVGIRLPWTVMGSEEVWHRTHRLGGKLWVVCGLVILIDAFAGIARTQVSIAALVSAGVVPVVYSYVIHRKLDK